MKSKLKKSLSLLLALVMAMSCMSMGAFANSDDSALALLTHDGAATEYATAQAALDAAVSGDTVTLYAGNHGTLYLRQVENVSQVVDVTHQDGEYGPNDLYRALSDVTIEGQEGANVDQFIIETGYYAEGASSWGTDWNRIIDSLMEIDNLTIKGVTFTLNKSDAAIKLGSTTRIDGLTVENCTVNGTGDYDDSERLLYNTLTSKKFESENRESVYNKIQKYDVSFTSGLKNLVVTGCTFKDLYQVAELQNLTGFEFTNNTCTDTEKHNLLLSKGGDAYSVSGDVVISGNTFNNVANERVIRISSTKDANITISNNTVKNFTHNEEFLKADGSSDSTTYSFSGNDWDGLTDSIVGNTKGERRVYVDKNFTVVESVAQIGTTKFVSLEDAFAAALNLGTATIDVIADCELTSPVSIPAGKDITLNIGSGVTVSTSAGIEVTSSANGVNLTSQNACGVTVIDNKGTLTITGDGTIDATSINAIESEGLTQYLINNEGTLVLNGGTFKLNHFIKSTILRSSGTATLNECEFDAWCALLNDDGGQMTINGGTYTGWAFSGNPGGYRYAVGQYGEGSKMTINGGEVYGIHGAVGISVGELVINDGYFETRNPGNVSDGTKTYNPSTYYVLYSAGERGEVEAVVNGGTFVNSGDKRAVYIANSSDGGIKEEAKAFIHGGVFRAKSSNAVHLDDKLGTLYVDGGTFYGTSFLSGASVDKVVADSCEAKQVGTSVVVDGVTYSKMYVIGKTATANESKATVTETKNADNEPVYTVYKDGETAVQLVDPAVSVDATSITNNAPVSELVDVAGVLAEAAANGAVSDDSTFEIKVVKGVISTIADDDRPSAEIASENVIEVHPELFTTTSGSTTSTEISNSNIKKPLTFKAEVGMEFANKTVSLKHLWKDDNGVWQSEVLPGTYAVDEDGYVSGVSLGHFSWLDPTVVSSDSIVFRTESGIMGDAFLLAFKFNYNGKSALPEGYHFEVYSSDSEDAIIYEAANESDFNTYRQGYGAFRVEQVTSASRGKPTADYVGEQWVYVKIFMRYLDQTYYVRLFDDENHLVTFKNVNGEDLGTSVNASFTGYTTRIKEKYASYGDLCDAIATIPVAARAAGL